MRKGFYLSLEAGISLLILVFILVAAIGVGNNTDLKELYILQKENDLLKMWAKEGISEKGMVSDFEFAFSGSCGFLEIDGKKSGGNCLGNSVASSAIFVDENLQKRKVTLNVFY